MTAVIAGDLDEVRSLFNDNAKHNNFDINYEYDFYHGRTILHLAVENNHIDMIKFLCENGANVNVQDRWGGSILDEVETSSTNIISTGEEDYRL